MALARASASPIVALKNVLPLSPIVGLLRLRGCGIFGLEMAPFAPWNERSPCILYERFSRVVLGGPLIILRAMSGREDWGISRFAYHRLASPVWDGMRIRNDM